jgi:hypothetical protein
MHSPSGVLSRRTGLQAPARTSGWAQCLIQALIRPGRLGFAGLSSQSKNCASRTPVKRLAAVFADQTADESSRAHAAGRVRRVTPSAVPAPPSPRWWAPSPSSKSSRSYPRPPLGSPCPPNGKSLARRRYTKSPARVGQAVHSFNAHSLETATLFTRTMKQGDSGPPPRSSQGIQRRP